MWYPFSFAKNLSYSVYFVGSINFGSQVAYTNIFYGQCSIVQLVSNVWRSYDILLSEV
jgi:hypothetical protein